MRLNIKFQVISCKACLTKGTDEETSDVSAEDY